MISVLLLKAPAASEALLPENVLAVIVAVPALKRAPPMPLAVLPETVQLFTTSVPVLWLLSAAPWMLWLPVIAQSPRLRVP